MDWPQPSLALTQAEHQISYGGCSTTDHTPLHTESPLGSRLPSRVVAPETRGSDRLWGTKET